MLGLKIWFDGTTVNKRSLIKSTTSLLYDFSLIPNNFAQNKIQLKQWNKQVCKIHTWSLLPLKETKLGYYDNYYFD